ncbi:DUF6438 domain-containing protein [Coleofasciculus sp. FACHB-1120]|uniref:DUF6438 domain-containing protein n=1 Tax=Coleofasciculus sp. FACHB-1120 TaxID=2692783 RepID=UPI0016881BD4|nr:DUF6438 domain-containing protein [Coleofasciculus sp. FACHB-1120]MBD2744852.1 hypothetical protein [Coleofasciculus sp. FACHB-1120]
MRSPLLLSLIIGVASSVLTVSIPNSPFLAAKTTTPNQRLLNQPQPVSRQAALTLERTACFGFCPIYKLTVYGNGKVVYEGKRFVKVTGTRTTTISKTAARKLIADFQKLNYFKLQDSYTGGHTDDPSAITSLRMGKKQKIVHYYLPSPDAPTQLTELENKIDTVVNSKQWIGTDAECAPRGTTK